MRHTFWYLATLVLVCGFAVGQSQYSVFYSFGAEGTGDGISPLAGFVYQSGQLFGATELGGSQPSNSKCYTEISGCGTVFAMEMFYNKPVEAVIYSFCTSGDPSDCPDGLIPSSGLIADAAGNLYGTTAWGGTGNCNGEFGGCGTVFRLTRKSRNLWTEAVLYSFNGPDGFQPNGLVFDAAGNLYGTTSSGGAYGSGNVFKLTPGGNGTWIMTSLHDFNPTVGDGADPQSGVAFDESGNLVGTTFFGGGSECNDGSGCGTTFRLSPNPDGTWTESVIYRFGIRQPYPISRVNFDSAGNIYGTFVGDYGSNSWGGIFRLSLQEGVWEERSFQFDGTDGNQPEAALLISDGAMFGTTTSAAGCQAQNCGNVFEIKGGQETVLYNFCTQGSECPDGWQPAIGGPLLRGENGYLYGATRAGGASGEGVIFQIVP